MNLILNHIGIVVNDIQKYLSNSIYEQADTMVYDPVQKADIALIKKKGQPAVELIQPKSEQAATYNFLKKTNGGLHHLCYEVPNLDTAFSILEQQRIKLVFGPVPAVLFSGSPVLFGYNRNREIIEFLITENG